MLQTIIEMHLDMKLEIVLCQNNHGVRVIYDYLEFKSIPAKRMEGIVLCTIGYSGTEYDHTFSLQP